MSSWQESRGHALLHGGFTSGRESDLLQLSGVDEVLKKLEAIQTSNPNFQHNVNKVVLNILKKARKTVMNNAGSAMNSDPRKARNAVKMMVYKRILGGNLSLLNRKRAGARKEPPPSPSRVGVRGGNRRPRSERTQNVMSYWGADRAFVLRFLNNGTATRRIRTQNNRDVNKKVGRGHTSASLQGFRNGNRGRISARNFFKSSSEAAIEQSTRELIAIMEEEIGKIWNAG